MTGAARAGSPLSISPREVVFTVGAGRASIVDVGYPPLTDFDTHEHVRGYLCLLMRGGYEEWSGPARSYVDDDRPRRYAAGSRHAVRTGRDGARILHVSDPSGGDWEGGASRFCLGILWQIGNEVRELGATADAQEDASALHLESLVRELGAGPAPLAVSPRWLEPALVLLREGYRQRLGLAELAAHAEVHPSHFARSFRTHVGMTAGEYLRRIRVSAAVEALGNRDADLARVAYASGFADQSHMGRCFRRYLGRTPAGVQARLRAGILPAQVSF
ncbi:MAG: AraC family transcriptional regulator [Gemmatimonadota bacterium]|nr:AraC family transcriptional regulator [Gemmatimonadota bacterium]